MAWKPSPTMVGSGRCGILRILHDTLFLYLGVCTRFLEGEGACSWGIYVICICAPRNKRTSLRNCEQDVSSRPHGQGGPSGRVASLYVYEWISTKQIEYVPQLQAPSP